jgi:hypothetical protein
MGGGRSPRPDDDGDQHVPFHAGLGVSARSARAAIRALARLHGFGPDALVEWSSVDANGGAADGLPPLYYAALRPGPDRDDMPLGLGDTAAAALADLLWTLGGPMLAAAVRADGAESPSGEQSAALPDGIDPSLNQRPASARPASTRSANASLRERRRRAVGAR